MGILMIVLGSLITIRGLWSVTKAFEEPLPNVPSQLSGQLRGVALFIMGEVIGIGLVFLGIDIILSESQ